MGEIAHPCPAVFFARRDAEHAEFAELRPQLARKRIAAVDLVGARRDLGVGETRDRVAQCIDILAEREVEPPPDIRDHWVSLPAHFGRAVPRAIRYRMLDIRYRMVSSRHMPRPARAKPKDKVVRLDAQAWIAAGFDALADAGRSEEHTSELQ